MGLLSTIGAASGRAFGLTRVSAAIRDAYFNLTTLLLPGDGTNGAQNNTFLDSSTNNFTITRNGNSTQGTFSPFSQTGWSNYLNGDYLSGSTSLFATNTSTFTIEAWLYPTALNSSIGENIVIGDLDPIGATLAIGSYINNSGQVVLAWYDGASKTCVSANTISLNQWSYVAIVVNSNAISMYVNSTTASSLTGTTTLTNRSQTNNFTIGMYAASFRTARWVGYLSNIRVSTVARSISSIPTAPYTSDANTRLLTCQSNRFVDNSTNAFTITRNGDVSVQPFSPFLPTIPYSAATVGGSGYFDAAGDYLSWSGTTFGTSAFTIECWVYLKSIPAGGASFMPILGNNNINNMLNFRIASSTSISLDNGLSASAFTVPTLVTNNWYHIVAVRNSSNQTTVFLNGTRSSTGAVSVTTNYSTATTFVGAHNDGSLKYFDGYMAGLRLVVGSSEYDPTQSSITVPTAPPTSVTNTSLLLNFTNAGITDATAKNALETVGNAQISTTQSKFGGSSMSFDGTGDYLRVPYSKQWALGGDFTIEFWINYSAHGNYGGIVSCANSNTGSPPSAGWAVVFYATTNNLYFEGQGGFNIQSSSSISTNTWTHCAVVRSGSTITMYIGGTSVGSGTSSTVFDSTSDPLLIGIERGFSGTMTGYIDDLRISRYARYTSAFTPPTAAFPLQ
jgi:hypothetical protein